MGWVIHTNIWTYMTKFIKVNNISSRMGHIISKVVNTRKPNHNDWAPESAAKNYKNKFLIISASGGL